MHDVTQTDHISTAVSRRLFSLLIPIGLALALMGLLVWPGLAYNFGHRFRLSTTSPYKAFNPDIGAGGDYVAAVWSEGYDSRDNTKEFGRVYLKSADVISGWEARIQVFPATNDVWGRHPRLVFDPADSSIVHVVWAQATGCSNVDQTGAPQCNWSSIQYATCDLTGADSCDPPVRVNGPDLENPSTPDVAVDGSGGVHVVWREGSTTAAGPVKYCKKGSCGTSSQIAAAGQHPSLAYANGYLHLVWDTGSGSASTIEYLRKGSSGWISSKTWWSGSTGGYQDPSYPTVGASDDAVYVVWAVQHGTEPTQYTLAFDFSSDTGANWVGPTSYGRSIPENDSANFTSRWFAADELADELYSLQPAVVVTGSGTTAYAHLVWHGGEVGGATYEAWYSYLAGYSGSADWTTPEIVVTDSHGDIGFAAIAVGTALSQTHVALVEDADSSSFGNINVWYVGANGNRDYDGDLPGPFFLPIIFKN